MRLIVIHNGETDSESRIYDTGDEKWPFEVHTPRGNWKVSDYPPALYVAKVAGKGVPRKPIAFRDVGVTTHGMPVTENPYAMDDILVYDIFEAAKVRACNAAEGREVRSVPTIAGTVHGYAENLFDDVIYSENPEGLIAEIEDTHRALLAVGFKPDHQIVLKMNEAYRTAYESLQ